MSSYLSSQKENLKRIVSELSKTYSYVSILGVDTKGKDYSVSKNTYSLGDSMWTERGFVIRIYNGKNYSEYSLNDLHSKSIDEIIEDIKTKFSESLKVLENNQLSLNDYPMIEEEAIKDAFFSDVEMLPSSLSSKEKIDLLSSIKNKALAYSDLLVDFKVRYEEVTISKLFISNKKELEQAYVWSQAFLVAIVRRNDQNKFFYDSFVALKGPELLNDLKDQYKEIIDQAIKLLDAKPIKPGMYDIICAPDVSGLIAHEAFGHGVEMDMFVKNRAKAMDYLSKPVGSSLVSMRDGAKSAYNVSSYLFDDEGSLGTDTPVIENGILKTGISDLLSALKLGTNPTGNGKRESFQRKAYARMTNTFFTGGKDKLEDMIASIKHGYLLEGVMSGMEDPKNWGIQCMLVQGKEIIDGKLTGKIVSPVIMTGYVPDVLHAIDMVSEEVKIDGSGICGKGYKEHVKTADGGPYIKTKGRLG